MRYSAIYTHALQHVKPVLLTHPSVGSSAGMWVAIVATIRQFRPVIGDIALLLLVPYLVWVSYASALTFWIWRNNPTGTGRVSGERRARRGTVRRAWSCHALPLLQCVLCFACASAAAPAAMVLCCE
jgi:hypothetical protein